MAGSGCGCEAACAICCSTSGVTSRKNSAESLKPALSMNLPSVDRYCERPTRGPLVPCVPRICSCFCRTIASIAICSWRFPVPNPTFTDTSYSFDHSRGSIETYLPRRRMTLGLSWYLHSRWRMLRKRSDTPPSAKILATNSIFDEAAFCIAATAVAVVFCKILGSSPCEARETPVRFSCTESRYCNIGND